MEKNQIIEVLGNWNFWNKDLEIGILRHGYLNKLLEFINTDKVISIIGVRRSGKSTLIRQMAKILMDKKVEKERILIVNFEEPYFENADLNTLSEIHSAFLEIIKPPKKPYIFLDEVQNAEKWEKFVRSLNERKEAFLVITGSSSKLLSKELASILTGRQLYFEVFPLSFKELLEFNKLKIKEEKDILLNSLEIKKIFRDYLLWGGFPEIVLNKNEQFKRKVLLSYYEDIINRDIIQRFKVKKFDKLKTLAHFYLSNISSYASFNKISKFLHLPVETVRRFSSYIETSYLIFFIKRFSYSLKEQENSPRKVYCIDTGLSEIVGFKFSQNLGRLLENLVALKIKQMISQNPFLEVYYWKNQYGDKEVDFLIKEGKLIKSLIQVCWNIENLETKERELKGLIKAMNEFNLNEGIIINEEFEGREKVKDKEIIYQPLWKWLLEN